MVFANQNDSVIGAPKTDFGQPPPGYVPGLGRGAIGFTTRSDIGPARPMAVDAARGRGVAPPPGFMGPRDPGKDYSESNFDEFAGYNESLFSSGDYDKDDDEADAVYKAIDMKMDSKRKARREQRAKDEMIKYRKKRPRIQDQFLDLKRKLASVSHQEWEEIPESLDYSRRNKNRKRRSDRFTPTPDQYLTAGLNAHGNVVAGTRTPASGINTPLGLRTPIGGFRTPGGFMTPMGIRTPSGFMTPMGLRTPSGFMTPMGVRTPTGLNTPMLRGAKTPMGFQTPLGVVTPVGGPTDLTQLGRARDKVLSLKLDRMADSVSGQTVVDPKGYLTDLNSLKVNSDAEVSDIKKARMLLKSVITTNPKHAPGWIAAARLEKETGKLATALAIITKGCEICSFNEDVWLEAARMHKTRNAKSILAKAVRHIPTSVKIWVAACNLEDERDSKKAVLRRALELIPNSVKLWKAAVELEEPEDARIMLSRAVELVPESVDMWLALARLESYENARVVLNKARQIIPTDPSIWITAAKLEEANGNQDNVDTIIQKAVKSLAAHQVIISRDNWFGEAEAAEAAGAIFTCQAIVRATIGIGVDTQDRKTTWMADAEHYESKGSVETARAVLSYMLTIFPGKKSIWMRAASLEKQFGTTATLDALLKKAVQYCPQAETLWLMGAKERWLADDVPGARAILNNAFAANPDSEQVWLAAVKLESENDEYERARLLLTKARERAGTARVWMKSAKLERSLGNVNEERMLLEESLRRFPTDYKLWIMWAQHLQTQNEIAKASLAYKEGVKNCPKAVDLWLCYARLEAKHSKTASKARSILETSRLKIPKTQELWLEAIKIEKLAGNYQSSNQLLAKALQECPSAGILWAHAIENDAPPLRKARSYDALKRCSEDPFVFCAVARLFWLDRKVRKARDWFKRAVTVDPDIGDSWAWWYKFELERGKEKHQRTLIRRVTEADPRHGPLWCAVSKNIKNTKEQLKPKDIISQVAANIKHVFPPNRGKE